MTLNIDKYLLDTLTNGGNTWPATTDGYMVSRTQDFSLSLTDLPTALTAAKVWLNANKSRVNEHVSNHLGAWVYNNHLYLEVSQRFTSRDEALAVGRARNQIAIYDVANSESIYLNTYNGEAA